ncbi:MAG: transcription termination/antitermination factor NusG [Clostridiales bacterium]|nr:transcription termination/antitermination factor NusG [Clostridiales bacterium]
MDEQNVDVVVSDIETIEATDTTEQASEVIEESVVAEEAVEAIATTSVSKNLIDDTTEIKVVSSAENAKWYALHTFSGYENVAKENLEIVKDKYSLQERIFDIVIPMEDVVEDKNGKKKIVSRKVMPGYIFVKMVYGDDIWHAVTRTRGITGFVGPKGRPLHLTDEEIRKMRLEKNTVIDISIAINDKVEVLDGALNGFVGTVLTVDTENAKCKVMVEMFGRDTPVDLNLDQVRKVD